MKLTFDLESRSALNLKTSGLYRYAKHASTDILCFAFKEHKQPAKIWVPEKFKPLCGDPFTATTEEFRTAIIDADIIEAHNAAFELALWAEIMVKRYGFPPIHLNKIRCSAALAATYALPRDLKNACAVMGTSERKDDEGHKIMLKFCKPRKVTKKNPTGWYEDIQDFTKLLSYCMQDTNCEESLSDSLFPIPDSELALFRLDHIINNRGLLIDQRGVSTLIEKIEIKEKLLLQEVEFLTEGQVTSVRQTAKTIAWLKGKNIFMDSIAKNFVETTLERSDILPDARRILEIRQQLGKSSVSKLVKMQVLACPDGRIRGTMMYHGASTGRWTAKGVQPHNLPRDSYGEAEVNEILKMSTREIETYYDDIFHVASRCVRGLIISVTGKKLCAADFSAVEARVLAWTAGETKVINAFNKGLDNYKLIATDIYNLAYDKISSDQRQTGKHADLACGYQGWVPAYKAILTMFGVEFPEDSEIERIVLAWRKSHPRTVALWKGIELAAIKAIRTKRPHAYGRIKFGVRGKFLHCRLPSGRLLSYFSPWLIDGIDVYGRPKTEIRFMGVDSKTKQWVRKSTYGGKLVENITQAISRDLLAEGMIRTEKAGYETVLHVHDEIVAENVKPDLARFIALMSVVPEWAKGCPINADGWIGHRYRK